MFSVSDVDVEGDDAYTRAGYQPLAQEGQEDTP